MSSLNIEHIIEVIFIPTMWGISSLVKKPIHFECCNCLNKISIWAFKNELCICLTLTILILIYLIVKGVNDGSNTKKTVHKIVTDGVMSIFKNSQNCRISIFRKRCGRLKLYCSAVQPKWDSIKKFKVVNNEKVSDNIVSLCECIKERKIAETNNIENFYNKTKNHRKEQKNAIKKYKKDTFTSDEMLEKLDRRSNHLYAIPIMLNLTESWGVLLVDINNDNEEVVFVGEVKNRIEDMGRYITDIIRN